MEHDLYFGIFYAYEEYYAIGETAEDVKKLLWKMYKNNFCGSPTKEDKRVFEDEIFIQKFRKTDNFGYETKYGECYTIKNNKLTRAGD